MQTVQTIQNVDLIVLTSLRKVEFKSEMSTHRIFFAPAGPARDNPSQTQPFLAHFSLFKRAL